MACFEARNLCPKGVLCRPHYDEYRRLSQEMFRILEEYTPTLVPTSIDEGFLDFTGMDRHGWRHTSATAYVNGIRARIHKEVGIPMSAGLATCSQLAKLATDAGKPGFLEIPQGQEKAFLSDRSVRDLSGIGERLQRTLAGLGARTFGDVAKLPSGMLRQKLGIRGQQLWLLANAGDYASCASQEPLSGEPGRSRPQHIPTQPRVRASLGCPAHRRQITKHHRGQPTCTQRSAETSARRHPCSRRHSRTSLKPVETAMHTQNLSDWLRSNTPTAEQGSSNPSSQRALSRAEQRCPLAGSAFKLWIRWGWRCLGTAVFLVLSMPAPAAPRPPLPPLPEMHLREWRFDDVYRLYPFGEAPALIAEADLVESWSGYALRREGERATPFVVPETEPTNRVNFTCGTGTFRFWFRPNWGSASLDGRGPGDFARLAELVSLNGPTPTVWWSLYATPDGTALYCSGQGRTGPTDLLKTEIQWAAETWHLIALTYNPTNTTLFVDGALVAVGNPLPVPPIPSAPDLALVLGSDLTGTGLAQGYFDEVTTFNRACDPWAMDWYHEATARHVAKGPVSEEEVAATQAQRAAASMRMAASAMAVADGGAQMLRLLGDTTSCITNVPVFITNISSKFDTNQGLTVTFDIQGGTNGLMYDIFTTTNLAGNNVTNSQWTWLEQGPTCSTYQYTNQPQPYAFYLLGTPQDSDGDGLTDAFEKLITRTNISTNDTDGDGVSDYLEWLQGRNPNAAGTVPDANSQIHLELYTPLR